MFYSQLIRALRSQPHRQPPVSAILTRPVQGFAPLTKPVPQVPVRKGRAYVRAVIRRDSGSLL